MSLLITHQESFAIITINRPKALNALNKEVFDGLSSFFDGTSLLDRDLRGVIITGSGDKAFAAGADIKEFTALSETESSALSKRGQDIMRRIETANVPVIAAVNGFALGGGCELAMCCHMIVASEQAVFGQPEVKLGLVPGYAATQRLAERIGRNRALEYLLTASNISAHEAYRMGLVNKVVAPEELISSSLQILETIAKRGRRAVAGCIQLVDDYYSKAEDGYLNESLLFGRQMLSEEGKEGIAAFIEKRKPMY